MIAHDQRKESITWLSPEESAATALVLLEALANWEEQVQVPAGVDVKIELTADKGKSLVATRDFEVGERLFELKGVVVHQDHVPVEILEHALQVGEGLFLASTEDHFDNYLNHSSHPNTEIQFVGNQIWVVACAPIKEGDHLTFFYPTTEWNMEEQGCAFTEILPDGTPGEYVGGFALLPLEEQLEWIMKASPYVQQRWLAAQL